MSMGIGVGVDELDVDAVVIVFVVDGSSSCLSGSLLTVYGLLGNAWFTASG